jgi:3'-phosphoadenosine 5'-phosphosulfate sulfotransferase (PAPS reductase)/FAD synthetase
VIQKKVIAIVSISGGKDSLATALLAIERYGRDRVILVWADTGHEHPLTVEYVTAYLPEALGMPVHVVKADFTKQIEAKRLFIARDMRQGRQNGRRIRWSNKAKRRALAALRPTGNPYLDLCMWKGRFPSRRAQFCTDELKRKPLDAFIDAMPDDVICESWRGIRRDESDVRRDAQAEYIDATKAGRVMRVVQPIVEWTAQQVIDYARDAGIKHNPLYSQGMKRVGCMPCINCGKDELLEIANRWPEEVDRVDKWEPLVAECSKRGFTSFFTDGARGDEVPSETAERLNIRKRVEWAKTSRGGLQYDLLRAIPSAACSSLYGLCE